MTRSIPVIGASIALFLQVVGACAAVTPVLIRLECYQTNVLNTYAVPSDKVLIIDGIEEFRACVELIATNGVHLRLSDSCKSLNRGIKIPGGTILQATPTVGNSETNYVCVYGSLVDNTDLYAQAPTDIQDIMPLFSEGMVSLTVHAGMDTIMRAEQSDDMASHQWTPVATFANGIAPERTIAFAEDNSSRQFFRVRTLSR